MGARKEFCPTKSKLLTAWQDAAAGYSKTVAELSRKVGVLSKPEYERLKKAAEIARSASMQAQADLEAHVQDHGCDGNGEIAA
jgi:hypothetical protein